MNDTHTNGLASVPAVMQYIKSAQACGVDCQPLILSAGIDPQQLRDNSKHISNRKMEHLLGLLIAESNDPCFGLHSAKFVELASYSVLGYICLNCATLRRLQAKIPVYEKIVGDMGVTSVEITDTVAFQRWHCMFSDPLVKRHEVENVIGSWIIYARNFLNFNHCESIWFEHEAPADPELLKDYAEIFGCDVQFNQVANGIRIPVDQLDIELPQANEKLLEMLLDHATKIMTEIDQGHSMTEKVKNVLRLLLKQHPPSSEIIAEKLGMSCRTLQRKLSEEGTQYKDVLNDLRLELALHYLRNTQLNMESIAYELGYAEPRSFYRSFKQWTGRTAGSYRESLL